MSATTTPSCRGTQRVMCDTRIIILIIFVIVIVIVMMKNDTNFGSDISPEPPIAPSFLLVELE